jgi:ATP-dependent protease HslVU (ClpYQ) peptidase subunit
VTVIAALVHEGTIYMGADRASITAGTYDLTQRETPKLFRLGEEGAEMLVGVAGYSRWGMVIRTNAILKEMQPYETPMRYMTAFAEYLRQLADEFGCLSKREPHEVEAFTLLAHQGHIYLLTGEFDLIEPAAPYMAIGVGDNIALGALYAGQGACPLIRLQRALEAAEAFSAGVRGPFIIETLASQGAGPEEPQGGLDHA